jgi:hypothetical protein
VRLIEFFRNGLIAYYPDHPLEEET